MKTTVEIPDELFRQAKARAALQGVPLKELIADGLRMILQAESLPQGHRVEFPLIRSKRTGPMITPEDVKNALNALDEEEAAAIIPFMRR